MARAIAAGQLVKQDRPAVVPEDLRDSRVVAVSQQVGGRFEGEDLPELANGRQGARAGAVGHLRERGRADAVHEYLRDTGPPAEQRRRGFEDEHTARVGERRPHAVSIGSVGDPGNQVVVRSFRNICRWPTPGPVPLAYAPSASKATTAPPVVTLGLSGL